MSKVMKKLLALLTIIGLSVGIVGVPQKSEAAFSHSLPAQTTYIEFVNYKGEELPFSMDIKDMMYVKASGTVNTGINTLVSATPLSITKTPGKNLFALHIPAFSGTVANSGRYAEFTTGFRATGIPFTLKYFGMGPPYGLGWTVKASASWINDTNGTSTQGFSQLTGPSPIPSGPPSYDHSLASDTLTGSFNVSGYRSFFNTRQMTSNSSGSNNGFTAFGLDGDILRFYVIFYGVNEYFEDDTGIPIPAPTGYETHNMVEVMSQPFAYQYANDSSLPKTYSDSSFEYTFVGWYKGYGKRANMVTTYPPSINFSATMNENEQEVHVVYKKRALRAVTEDYVDTSGGIIESSWSTSQTLGDGDTFTQTPAATKTDTSGTDWEYQGWKLDSEPMSAMRPWTTPVSVLIDANKNIQYVYKKTEHTITEKWVDRSDGTTLVPMTGNPATNSIDDNDHFTGSATATITDSGGGIWDFIGWENVTDDPGNVIASPAYAVNNIKGNKEIRYHYQARNTTATLDLTPTPQVVSSGDNVSWSSRLSNTGTSSLNNLTLKATSNWASGLSHPTQVTITPSSGAPANFTVGAGDWLTGVTLTGVNIPMGQSADITFTDTATGAVNQVLPAEIEITGNMASPLTAANFVRIDDPDEPNLNPTGNAGLINIPKFEFGEVEVKPFAQTKGLDAASYQAGYNPYIRYKDQESLVGWDLTVKLSQFTSGSKTLPTTTSIKLNNGDLKEVQNYNKDNETLSSVGSIGNKTIFSDGTTVALTNGAAQGVYQLDYAFNDVELDLLAYSGIAGLKYEADLDWTLTTTP